MTKNLPRVGFVFDGMATSPVFFGWSLGTLWNGFDNVAVSVDTRDMIADWFEQIAQDSETAADLREIAPDSGRVDLSGGYTTRIVPQWRAEFPDYPVDDMPDPLPAGFVDHSWHNDDCPSFWHEATRTLLWVDYLDPSRREIEERPRFALMKTDENGASTQEPDCCVFQGETWLEVEAFLREYLPAAPTYPPAVDESNQADAPLPAVVSYRVEVREILTYHFDVEASSNAEAEAKAMAAFKAIQDSAEAADMVEDRHAFAHESYKI